MKLPWDKDYFKVSFYCILSAVTFYAIKLLIDASAYIFKDMGKVAGGLRLAVLDLFRILSPLVAALIFAYLFDPLVSRIQKGYDNLIEKHGTIYKCREIVKLFIRKLTEMVKKLHFLKSDNDIKQNSKRITGSKAESKTNAFRRRTAGTILTYIVILLIIVVLVIGVRGFGNRDVPLMESLSNEISSLIIQFGDMLVLIKLRFAEWGLAGTAQNFIDSITKNLNNTFFISGEKTIKSLVSAGRILGDLFIGLVVAFYFLQRKEELLFKVDDIAKILLPGKLYKNILDVLRDLNTVFSGYIRGQMTDAFIMAVLISSGLKLIGIDFAIIIGVITGFSNLVPFLGALVGFVLSVTMGLITGPPIKAVYAAIFLLVAQQIDSMFIIPKVVGRNVKLSPPAVILAVVIGARTAGFLGMVLAVPVFSVSKVWMLRYMEKRKIKRELSQLGNVL